MRVRSTESILTVVKFHYSTWLGDPIHCRYYQSSHFHVPFSSQVLLWGIAVHNRNGIRGPGRGQFTSFITVYVFNDIAVMIIRGFNSG